MMGSASMPAGEIPLPDSARRKAEVRTHLRFVVRKLVVRLSSQDRAAPDGKR